MYEIRSALDVGMAADVSGASKVEGANVQLYAVNHTNAQKFYIDLEETSKWSIRAVYSGYYFDVAGAAVGDGTNVRQWHDNDTDAQRWKITQTGETVNIDGKTCDVVSIGSYVTASGEDYMLDVSGAMTTNKTNIQIWHDNGTLAQRFVLYPTIEVSDTLPQPSFLGAASVAGGTDYAFTLPAATKVYPGWQATFAWASNTTNGFRWRWERRLLKADTSTWVPDDWFSASGSSWYEGTGYTRDGQTYYATAGVDGTFDTSTYKAMQYHVIICSRAGTSGAYVQAPAITGEFTVVTVPDVALTTAGFGPEGLRIEYESDYDGGTTNIMVTSVVVGGEELLPAPVRFDGLAVDGSVLVPMDALAEWIEDGADAAVTYQVGTDMYDMMPTTYTETLEVSYDAGAGTSLDPTITVGDDRLLVIDLDTNLPVQDVYVRCDGETYPATRMDDGTFAVAYPFGTEFDVFATAMSTDQTTWDYWHQHFDGNPFGTRSCHAWNWDGGSFALELELGGIMSTERSIKANNEALSLNKREFQSVYLMGSYESTWTATGAARVYDQALRDKLDALRRAGHVTYRSPRGDVVEVAITDIQHESTALYTRITVNMIEETR